MKHEKHPHDRYEGTVDDEPKPKSGSAPPPADPAPSDDDERTGDVDRPTDPAPPGNGG
jgi:hypothetical protein